MLLQVPFDDDADDEIFDIYGNYVYPFDIKIKQPNTALGSANILYLAQASLE